MQPIEQLSRGRGICPNHFRGFRYGGGDIINLEDVDCDFLLAEALRHQSLYGEPRPHRNPDPSGGRAFSMAINALKEFVLYLKTEHPNKPLHLLGLPPEEGGWYIDGSQSDVVAMPPGSPNRPARVHEVCAEEGCNWRRLENVTLDHQGQIQRIPGPGGGATGDGGDGGNDGDGDDDDDDGNDFPGGDAGDNNSDNGGDTASLEEGLTVDHGNGGGGGGDIEFPINPWSSSVVAVDDDKLLLNFAKVVATYVYPFLLLTGAEAVRTGSNGAEEGKNDADDGEESKKQAPKRGRPPSNAATPQRERGSSRHKREDDEDQPEVIDLISDDEGSGSA